jgi:hypothetical protein
MDKHSLNSHPGGVLAGALNKGNASPIKAFNDCFNASRKVSVSAAEVRVCTAFEGRAKGLLCLD